MSENIAKYNVILELIANTKGIDDVDKKVTGLQKTFNIVRNTFIGIFAGIALNDIGKQIFDVTAKFQGYESVLKNTLGSGREAAKSLEIIKETAKGTVYSVDELTSSYLKFANRGIKLTSSEIIKLADIAASQGKSFDQLTEAVLDAQTGEFERLKEFGIRASKSGDEITFAFKGVNTTIKNTPEAINALISSYGDLQGVQGSNITQMETLNGRMSNIGDTVDDLFVKIGKALLPVFNFLLDIVVSVVAGLTTFVNVLIGIPKFIKENAAAFKALGVAVVSFNIPLIISTAALIKNTIATRAKAIADLFLAEKTGLLTRAQWLLNAAFAANPIGLIVGAVALLTAGFIILYNKSESVRNVFSGILNVGKSIIKVFKDVADSIQNTFENGIFAGFNTIGNKVVDFVKRIFTNTFSDLENIVSGKDIGNSALRLAKRVLSFMTLGLSSALTEAGKFVIDSFTKGFEENKQFEAKVRVKLNRGSLGGSEGYSDVIRAAKEANEKLIKSDEEAAKARKEANKKLSEQRAEALKKAYEKEKEAINKKYALEEQSARKLIKNADDLAKELEKIEIQHKIALLEIEQKYTDKTKARYTEISNELDELDRKYNKLTNRAKIDPLDLMPSKLKNEVISNITEIQNKIKDLETQYNQLYGSQSSGIERIDILKKIKELRKAIGDEIDKFDSPKLNKLKFISGGESLVNIEDLLPSDQIDAIKDRLKVVQNVLDSGIKPKNVTEYTRFEELKAEAKKLTEYLDNLGVNESNEGFIQRILGLTDEQFGKFKQDIASAYEAIKESINKILEAEIEATDQRIELQQKRVDKAAEIAEKGNVKQLEIEEARLRKLQEEREKYAQAQRILSETQILQANAVAAAESIRAIATAFGEGGPAGIVTGTLTALALAAQIAAIVTTVKSSFSDLPSYKDGIESFSTKPDGKVVGIGTWRSDSVPAMLSNGERVVDAFTNYKLGDFPNSKLPEAVKYYQLRPKGITKIENNKTDNTELLNKLDNLQAAFEALRINVSLDKKGFVAELDRLIQRRVERKRFTA